MTREQTKSGIYRHEYKHRVVLSLTRDEATMLAFMANSIMQWPSDFRELLPYTSDRTVAERAAAKLKKAIIRCDKKEIKYVTGN